MLSVRIMEVVLVCESLLLLLLLISFILTLLPRIHVHILTYAAETKVHVYKEIKMCYLQATRRFMCFVHKWCHNISNLSSTPRLPFRSCCLIAHFVSKTKRNYCILVWLCGASLWIAVKDAFLNFYLSDLKVCRWFDV